MDGRNAYAAAMAICFQGYLLQMANSWEFVAKFLQQGELV
jgi:hypothetical protein